MTQYCRYCCYLCVGDANYCSEKQQTMHRNGKGCELNPDYFRDGVGYLQAAENEVDEPTLFDFM